MIGKLTRTDIGLIGAMIVFLLFKLVLPDWIITLTTIS